MWPKPRRRARAGLYTRSSRVIAVAARSFKTEARRPPAPDCAARRAGDQTLTSRGHIHSRRATTAIFREPRNASAHRQRCSPERLRRPPRDSRGPCRASTQDPRNFWSLRLRFNLPQPALVQATRAGCCFEAAAPVQLPNAQESRRRYSMPMTTASAPSASCRPLREPSRLSLTPFALRSHILPLPRSPSAQPLRISAYAPGKSERRVRP